MHIRVLVLVCTVALVFLSYRAHAQATSDINSGNYYLIGCQALARNDTNMTYRAGECGGALRAIFFTLNQNAITCIPSTVTVGQVARVVVKHLENSPEHLHESFYLLAAYALGVTWPCSVRK